ncbi:MAG: group I truncated hemoglobin [Moraxellaceae bacterium]
MRLRQCRWSLLLVAGLALPLSLPAQAQTQPQTLYAALGGETGVADIVRRLVDKAVADPATRRSFAEFNRARLEKLLAQQICALGDGGCRYEGDDMKRAHQGLDITEAEFYALVAQLRAACDETGVPQAAKNRLLARLAPMKRDIVTK